MKKTYLSILVVLAVLLAGAYWYMGEVPGGEHGTQQMNAAVLPLYTGATWGTAASTTSADYGEIVQLQSQPFTDVTDIAAISSPFTKYYEDKLTSDGWVRDMSREAGGPGAEVSVYTKGDQFIVVAFRSVFKVTHPDAPSECPCDVTFTLSSGTQVGPTQAEIQATHVYHDTALGFSLTLPTAIASSSSDSEYSVDTSYKYTAQGPGKAISGVKFTIPKSTAAGTNLSSDSYISVEYLPGPTCDAAPFMSDPSSKSSTVREGVLSYSVASSTDAAVGNRYEETVYARSDSNPCIAVRYFIHYGAIQNYPEGQVREFDKAALLEEFDQIRRTLALKK